MRRTPFYNFFIVALLVTMTASVSAQQVDSKLPWSVRLTESAARLSAETEVGLLPRT